MFVELFFPPNRIFTRSTLWLFHNREMINFKDTGPYIVFFCRLFVAPCLLYSVQYLALVNIFNDETNTVHLVGGFSSFPSRWVRSVQKCRALIKLSKMIGCMGFINGKLTISKSTASVQKPDKCLEFVKKGKLLI